MRNWHGEHWMFYVLNLKTITITEYGLNNVYSVALIIKICSICLYISNKDWLEGDFFLSCWFWLWCLVLVEGTKMKIWVQQFGKYSNFPHLVSRNIMNSCSVNKQINILDIFTWNTKSTSSLHNSDKESNI